ncbi:hypothetical protein ES703_63275 [subsurface metagenome]
MPLDPITVEVISNALTYSSEEAGIALRNSAYSHNIKERMDHSCALLNPQGELLAQAEHIPTHLGSLPWGLKNVLRYVEEKGEEWHEGDVIMLNDPYIAGTHLNDITLIKPIFFAGNIIGFSANKAHHVDVGGEVPGSISCDATSLYQEGVVVPPVKLIEQGDIKQSILDDYLAKVRAPDIGQGDLRAQIAAVNLGERRVLELTGRYGITSLMAAFDEIISYGERRMIEKLKVIPEGTYTAEDCLEDIENCGDLTWIRVTLRKEAARLDVDFSGTDPQVAAPLNTVFGVTISASYFAIKSIVDPEAPMNGGLLRPIRVIAPEGSLVNPRKPAPVAGGNLETNQRIVDTIFKALAEAVPDRVPAASHGSMNNVMVGGFDPDRNKQWVYYETNGGGSGGRPGKDGVDGIQCNMTNTMNTPIETLEQYYPMLFEEYELRPNTYGTGKWRGGCGIKRSWTLLSPSAEVTVLGERHKIAPWGLEGGQQGSPGAYWIIRSNGRKERIGSKATLTLKKGDRLIIETPGGGGYGSTEERGS